MARDGDWGRAASTAKLGEPNGQDGVDEVSDDRDAARDGDWGRAASTAKLGEPNGRDDVEDVEDVEEGDGDEERAADTANATERKGWSNSDEIVEDTDGAEEGKTTAAVDLVIASRRDEVTAREELEESGPARNLAADRRTRVAGAEAESRVEEGESRVGLDLTEDRRTRLTWEDGAGSAHAFITVDRLE